MKYDKELTDRDLQDIYVLQNFTVTVGLVEELADAQWYLSLRESRIEEGIEWDQ